MNNIDQIKKLIEQGALFFVSHSGGKDSQAMYLSLRNIVPREQLIIVHANLPGVEWEGVIEHIKTTCDQHAVNVVSAAKTFLEMVEKRGMWPSAQFRQCTSDLKTGPIDKFIRHTMKARGSLLAVNCTGIRAQESSARSKQTPFKLNAKLSKAGRTVYNWMPIFDMLVDEVFATIKACGQKPHAAYQAGMSRLSCCFCILANKSDLQTAARLKPDLYAEYVALEKKIGHTFLTKQSLEDFTGIKA